jgi:hypothetical protein
VIASGLLFVLTASLTLRTFWPCALAGLLALLLVLRTAAKNRWKKADLPTRLLYGVHSHIQQIPIFLGQLQYARDRRHSRRRGLIEYKAAG